MGSAERKTKTMKALGVGLIVFSGILWAALLAVPVLPLSSSGKGMVAGALLILAEVAFWVGLILVGKEYADKIKQIPRRILALIKEFFGS